MTAKRLTWLMPTLEDSPDDYVARELVPAKKKKANLVGSLAADGKHYPVLDIDFPAKLVPSSTEGHFHLFLDRPLTSDQYQRVINVLTDVGILEEGIRIQRNLYGQTLARLHKKPEPPVEHAVVYDFEAMAF